MNRVLLQPAFVLHRRNYRDTSLIVEVWTPDYGRVAVMAKGARRAKSPLQGLLQSFRPLLMSWSGRGELKTLVSVEPNGPPLRLCGRISMSGMYINELLLRLLHRDDPHPALFDNYATLLTQLAQLETANKRQSDAASDPSVGTEQRLLRLFEKRLLDEVGYGLVLDRDATTGEPVHEDKLYRFYFDQGPVISQRAADQVSGVVLKGQSLLALARDCLNDDESLRDAKRLMRAAIDMQLGDKPLLSRQLRQAYERERAGIG
jgi:DNA repair protein RecO (recombination protein O)